MDFPSTLSEIRSRGKLSQERLAQLLGVSFVSVSRWERGAGTPSPAQAQRIADLHRAIHVVSEAAFRPGSEADVFASRGIRRKTGSASRGGTPSLFDSPPPEVVLSATPLSPLLDRLGGEQGFASADNPTVQRLLQTHAAPAMTVDNPSPPGMSAGKNTYTYDAHTYHTKVPPQGIAELVRHYLPEGGLVLDPFAGSGMTGVACRANGYNAVLNELSPAACFIGERFTSCIAPALFEAGVHAVLGELRDLRAMLYTTTCRECGRPTELLYTVWSYRVLCTHCRHEFSLWDHCRHYGKRVRDHKILGEFPCPACGRLLQKKQLTRTHAAPVQVGYKCCGSRQQEVTHPPNTDDLELISRLEEAPPLAGGFFPRDPLPDGVNLRQPKNHGLDRIDRLYTPRNLAAMSYLWRTIHRVEDVDLAAQLGFVFTSLYQRVTRLSEFRFWGGSGNTARYNVPFIFNETNVFVTFARKARTIRDHLEATATHYRGEAAVIQHSATALDYLPADSVDLVFTDPPFGANINYSDMNFLWESWLGKFTDTQHEAVINKVQGKDVQEYQQLMALSMAECYRVLRHGHWMLLVFMNSSREVWLALKSAIVDAGFEIRQVDIFDKQHGTFKHFVSENTAGADLVLHCRKPMSPAAPRRLPPAMSVSESVRSFLAATDIARRTNVYLHVNRQEEPDFRSLYSEWMAHAILHDIEPVDFGQFRVTVEGWLRSARAQPSDGASHHRKDESR